MELKKHPDKNPDKKSVQHPEANPDKKTISYEKPLVMGILNVTPNSFSDGGRYFDESDEKRVRMAAEGFEKMIEDGADIIDIGGESTGPGSKDVPIEEEIKRVIPVLKDVRKRSDILISVDTYKAEVAKQAIENGADIINDVLALRGDRALADVLAKTDIPVIFMFSKEPTGRTSGDEKIYEDVIKYIDDFFTDRINFAEKAGIKRERIILDPGQGAFISGDVKYSLQILKRLEHFKKFGLPICLGASRKSVIGETLNLPMHERLEGSLACAAVALMNGANIIRAHDVKETRRLADMIDAIMKS
jgi:dihydropteroate synthase